MDISYSQKKIEFEKEFNALDSLAFSFCSILNSLDIKYVIISGYVAILFGRNRASEDIDMFIERMSYAKFKIIWDKLTQEFECLNTSTSEEAYKEYLQHKIALRFSYKNKYVPNIELKFPTSDLDESAMQNRIETQVNKKIIYIAPIEPQIIFKLYLGSEKDLEDARFLYTLFKEKLDKNLMEELFRKLNIEKEYKRYIE